jgi:hypothetical protein
MRAADRLFVMIMGLSPNETLMSVFVDNTRRRSVRRERMNSQKQKYCALTGAPSRKR